MYTGSLHPLIIAVVLSAGRVPAAHSCAALCLQAGRPGTLSQFGEGAVTVVISVSLLNLAPHRRNHVGTGWNSHLSDPEAVSFCNTVNLRVEGWTSWCDAVEPSASEPSRADIAYCS
jgi:hypothetical protein